MIPARALFLADGPSDEPLGRHVAALAREQGVYLDVVTPDLSRLERPPGKQIAERLRCVLGFDPDFDVVIIHRDAEGQAATDRIAEIEAGTTDAGVNWPVVPIIPIRMTEAWLLLDEGQIRSVAGRPSSSHPLHLPTRQKIESLPDPKTVLEEALSRACGLSGRRLNKFKRDFSQHRRQLLDRLDRKGAVCSLSAWQTLEADLRQVMPLVRANKMGGHDRR